MSDTPADWYPDPSGRHELRYWDGQGWTDHVSSHGKATTDPLQPGMVPQQSRSQAEIQKDLGRAGVIPGAPTGGGLFDQPVLVVSQKAKLIEVNNEYTISDQHGNQIGAVRQVGQSTLKKAMRVLTSYDQFMTHKLQVVDGGGNVVLGLTRPAKILKSRVEVSGADGRLIGEVKQRNAIGKIRFGFEVNGAEIGTLNAENWRAWNFSIQDHTGAEVARITKTWEGLAKTLFTTADNYVVQIHRPLDEPLRSLVVGAALAVDTALKQDSRGFG